MKTPRKAENPGPVMITIRLGKSETSEPMKKDGQEWPRTSNRYQKKMENRKYPGHQQITIQLGKPDNPGPMKNDIEEMSMEKPEAPGPSTDNHPTWKAR